MSAFERVCVLPRWAGHAESDWYPWLRGELARSHAHVRVDMLTLPNPGAPTIEGCLAALQRELGQRLDELRGTLLVGHSVGNQALLRYLATLPASAAERATLLCVAGWWTIDQPWPTLLPWLEPFDVARVRAALAATYVLLGDDDPFTRDFASNRARWQVELDADVELVPGAKHFNGAREPAVLARVQALLDASRSE
jgi:hypothetical protein